MVRSHVSLILLAVLVCSPVFAKGTPAPPAPRSINVPMAQRPRMAVLKLDDGSIQRQEWWGKDWDVGTGLADVLTSSLMQRNRFRLIERAALKDVLGEQALANSAVVDPKKAAELGKVAGVDYLIIGKVTEFAWEKKDSGGVLKNLGVAVSSTEARVAVDLRVVDTTTSEIVGAYAGVGKESKSSVALAQADMGAVAFGSSNFMQSILGKATRAAMENWTDEVCRAQDAGNLKLDPKGLHPDGKVVMIDGDTIISNTGENKGYCCGEKVEIHHAGKTLTDPDTGEVLRVVTELVARGEITKVDKNSADIKFTCCEGKQPAEGDLVKFCAPAAPAPAPAPVESAANQPEQPKQEQPKEKDTSEPL